ncbi:MAG: hypothetical protein MNPFHGCM_02198 [Gemmatimonadaceae bacterium]|nr:hypothetical protein [Gemmatimonadaceae bacterium]
MSRMRLLLTVLVALHAGGAAVAAQQPGKDVTGKWTFAVTTENGTGYPAVTLKQEGERVTGTYESQRMGLRLLEGTIKGDTLRLTLKSASSDVPDFSFVGVLVDRDNVKGTLEMGGMGSAVFAGKRESKP